MKYSSNALRQAFLDFFAERDHEVVASSSLVPINDPTLLFTNAGMVQFKDVFLGREKRAIPRAVSSQRCVRAGGKHNDLENVGYTARHHTFFEMLGNFSFGDYFKRDAIRYAWAFVTEVLELPPERLWCTVYKDDDEAASIWLEEIGVDPTRFARLGEDENFWAMGDTGPCGPCSEIFYDHGPELEGGPPGSPDADGDRYVEIWNLVFMQYERDADGNMTPLPKPSVDTGMGLERMAAVMQGVHSNYEIDLFARLIEAAAAATGTSDRSAKSLRVIADHIRACAFLIADGVEPGNEGRGYVLRRIIRRAVRHGFKLGVEAPFFHTLVAPLEAEMGEAHPELTKRRAHVERVLEREEKSFFETLSQGMHLLDEATDRLAAGDEIAGDVVFKLHDTYGFPVDLTADIARERGFEIDQAGFDARMAEQRERARRASRFGAGDGTEAMLEHAAVALADDAAAASGFLGYEALRADGRVVALFDADGGRVERLESGARGLVVLDRTPFYAESGGQIGDTGGLSGAGVRFDVEDTQKAGPAYAHIGTVAEGALESGATLTAAVDGDRRARIVLNHSATHLLHAALRRVLGEHVQQKGSLVAPDRLRFDFSHYDAVTGEQIAEIEYLVNEQIRANVPADTAVMTYEEAMNAGALAFFGEKYDERVRVLQIGDFSTELCGGTHVSRAGDIGVFKIITETGIASGVRRIEAVTGPGALEYINANDRLLRQIASMLRGTRDDVADRVSQLVARSRQLEREVQTLKAQLATGGAGRDLVSEAREVNGIKLLVTRMDGVDDKSLREAADQLKNRLGSGVVVIGGTADDKVRLVAAVTKDLKNQVHAGNLLKPIAEHVGGKAGGRPDFGQGGGNRPERLDEALARVEAELGTASTPA